MPRRLLLVAVVVLLALLATRALALSSEDTRTGDKPAVDKEGKGTRYTYGMEMKEDDPYHITIPMPNYGTYSQLEGGSYVWKHGDEFYIEASKLYGQGRVNGTYQFRAYHYITLWYKDTMVNITAYDSHLDPENPYLYTSFSLSWTSTGAKTVKSWSNSPTVSLGAAQGDYRYGFFSNTGAVSGRVGGGITVYSGTYNLKTHSWFQLLTTTSGGGGGGGGGALLPFRISIAVVNSTEAANFTARVTGWYYDGQGWGWHRIDSTLHALYNPGFTLNAYTVELHADTLTTQGYIAGKLVKHKKDVQVRTVWLDWSKSSLGEYLTGPYLVKVAFYSCYRWWYRLEKPDSSWRYAPYTARAEYGDLVLRSFQALYGENPTLVGDTCGYGYGDKYYWPVEWRVYEGQPVVFEFLYWEARWYDTSGVVWEWKTLRISNPDITLSPPADPKYGVTVTAYYAARKPGQQVQVRGVGLGTLFLPGEAVPAPWVLNSSWAWSGAWLLNVTELYPVGEHLVALVLDEGLRPRYVVLPGGTSLVVRLNATSWAQCRRRATPGGEILYLDDPGCLPRVVLNGSELYFLGLAAWDPTKQGYDTSCWLGNGTTLAVYNVTYTYTFQNGTRVTFIQPVVVSTLRVSAAPVYSYGDLKQGLALRVAVEWRYLPPARLGLGVSPPPETVVAAVSIGGRVYAGRLVGIAGASRVFEVPVASDTWQLYVSGARSLSVEARWLTSYGEPGAPVKLQESLSLRLAYAMPHIDAISEGSSLTATISVLDIASNQPYAAQIYLELRDNRTYAVVSSHGPFVIPGQGVVSVSMPNTKQYVLAIYAVPVHDPRSGRLVVPIAAVYPPRA